MLLAWSVAALLAAWWLAGWASASLIDGGAVPVGYDSFYHARRILDAAAPGGKLVEFETRMHYPEGSWITWPWAYDWSLAMLLRAASAVFPQYPPMLLLAFVPPLALAANLALLAAAGRQLGLTVTTLVAVLVSFAMSPGVMFNHTVGAVDHHWAEAMVVLATILLLLRWLERPEATGRAVVLGVVLGLAPGVHNGMFFLQGLVVAGIGLAWVARRLPPGPAPAAFGLAMLLVVVLVVLPSEPFRQGETSFYLLGSFHIAVAAYAALLMAVFAGGTSTPRRWIFVVLVSVAGVVHVAPQLGLGVDWTRGDLDYLRDIAEAQSITDSLRNQGSEGVLSQYSWWPLGVPFALWGCFLLWRRAPAAGLALGVLVIAGATMYASQNRFWYIGLPPVLLAAGVFVDHLRGRALPSLAHGLVGLTLAVTAIATAVPYLTMRLPLGGDSRYMRVHVGLQRLAAECARAPGVVLAERNLGHYITYATDCTVIGNNFILTDQHLRKLDETELLIRLPIDALRRTDPPIHYLVTALPDDLFAERVVGREVDLVGTAWPSMALLADDAAPAEGLEPLFQSLARSNDGGVFVSNRFYRIVRAPMDAAPGS
jgi:hypothetical protein